MGFVNEQQRLTNQKNHIFFHSFVHFTSWRLHFPYFFHFCVPYCRFEFLVRWSVNAWVFFEKSLSEFFFSLCVVSSVHCIYCRGGVLRILVFGMMKALKQHSIAPGWPEIYCFVVNTQFFDISVSGEWNKQKNEKENYEIRKRRVYWKKNLIMHRILCKVGYCGHWCGIRHEKVTLLL